MKILEIEDLNVVYRGKEKDVFALKDISLIIEEGDSVGIVGESGSGKSTLALSILRLLNHKRVSELGKIIFKGQDLVNMSESEINRVRWKELAVVFQKSMNSLSPIHKVGSQMEDVYRVHEPKESIRNIKKHIFELFKLVNLSKRVYNLYPHELSGGMLQRIAIALSLIHKPSLLIMDEATTALDVVTQGQILREIQKIETEMKMTRIMITHDISVVASSCKRVIVLYAGEIMESGFVKDVLSTPAHPYTRGLISSFPTLRGEKKVLSGIKGFMPDLSKKSKGCIFASRCEFAKDICRKVKPPKYKLRPGHESFCHMHGSEF